MQARKKVISINISLIQYEDAIHNIVILASNHLPAYACFSNAHMTMEALQDQEFGQMVDHAHFVFADGMPLVFGLRFLYGISQPRIAGMDFMIDSIRACEERGLSVFLFGSTDDVLIKLKKNLVEKFPGLKIAGSISPPFGDFTEKDNENFAKAINESGANLVMVSLGCPKQEKWMAKNYLNISAPLLGVGGAFAVHALVTMRAPSWMQRSGLEWLYRLSQEPRRLFKRYLITNSLFIFHLLKAKIKTILADSLVKQT